MFNIYRNAYASTRCVGFALFSSRTPGKRLFIASFLRHRVFLHRFYYYHSTSSSAKCTHRVYTSSRFGFYSHDIAYRRPYKPGLNRNRTPIEKYVYTYDIFIRGHPVHVRVSYVRRAIDHVLFPDPLRYTHDTAFDTTLLRSVVRV